MNSNNSKPFLLGSLIASLFASACCIGPIIFAVLGISSFGFLSVFDEYRGVISIVAIALLALGFYTTYKKKPVLECAPDSYCSKPSSDIWNKRILWIITILTIAILTFPNWSVFIF